MKYEDMTPAEQRDVDRAIGRRSSAKGKRTRPRPSRAEVVLEPGERDPGGSCSCGETFPDYPAWEKHRKAEPGPEHARWEITVTPRP